MKIMKKTIFLVALVAIIAFALITPVFAGSITIDNYESDADYDAYKILDVTYDTNGHYSYTIDSTSPWWSVINGYSGLTKTQIGTSTTYIVTEGTGFDAAELAKTLYAAISGKTATGTFDNATLSGLTDGYYFVTTTTGTVCSITTVDPTANIVDKNIAPSIEKTVDDADKVVYVGQEVEYTITGELPEAAKGFSSSYIYEITDTMSAGLTFDQSSVAITVDGTTYTPASGELTTTATGFTLSLDLVTNTTLKNKLGEDIVITYTAKVDEDAITRASEVNSAVLKYSNDPADETDTDETTPEVVTLKTANIVINKIIQGSSPVEKLAGAKFTLTNSDGKYYTYDDTNDTVVWSNSAVVYTSDGINTIDFNGLDAGTYTLTETEAPDGYNKLTDPLIIEIGLNGSGAFVIGSGTSTEFSVADNGYDYVADVANATGTELPTTGGKGTIALISVGTVLFMTTAIVLVTKKRLYNEG